MYTTMNDPNPSTCFIPHHTTNPGFSVALMRAITPCCGSPFTLISLSPVPRAHTLCIHPDVCTDCLNGLPVTAFDGKEENKAWHCAQCSKQPAFMEPPLPWGRTIYTHTTQYALRASMD